MTQSRILLAVVAAVAAAAAFFFMVLSPKRDEIAKLDTDIAAKKAELTTNQQLVADYQTAKSGYRTAYASVVRLGKAVPVEDDVRSLMVQVDAAAGRSGVSFNTISVSSSGSAPAAAGTPGAFTPVPFSFTFTGSYFDLADFVRRLERFVSVSNSRIDVTGRLLQLQSLSLAPAGGGFPRIQASIGATSYLIPPGQGLTGGATPAAPGAAATAAPAATPAPAAPSTSPATPPTTTATVTGAVR